MSRFCGRPARASHSTDPRRAFCGTWMLCFWAGEVVQMASGDLLTYWRVLPVYFFVLALAVRGMKLLLLDQFSDPGGAQQVLLDLLPAIRERGWDALVGLPGERRAVRARARARASRRSESSAARTRRAEIGRAMSRGFSTDTPRLARQIRVMARGRGPGVHQRSATAAGGVARADCARRSCFIRIVSRARDRCGASPGGALRRHGRVGDRELRVCRGAVAASMSTGSRSSINGVSGAAPYRRRDAPVGAPASRASDASRRRKDSSSSSRRPTIDPALVAATARFTIYGAALFAEAGAEAYDREVRARAAGLPVEFAGWVDDVYAALADIDILLVPSRAARSDHAGDPGGVCGRRPGNRVRVGRHPGGRRGRASPGS